MQIRKKWPSSSDCIGGSGRETCSMDNVTLGATNHSIGKLAQGDPNPIDLPFPSAADGPQLTAREFDANETAVGELVLRVICFPVTNDCKSRFIATTANK
jgi:hypothetical protein